MKVISQPPQIHPRACFRSFRMVDWLVYLCQAWWVFYFFPFISSRYFSSDSFAGHRVHFILFFFILLLLLNKLCLSMQPAASLARKKNWETRMVKQGKLYFMGNEEGELKSIHLIVRVELMCARHAKEKKAKYKVKMFRSKIYQVSKWKGKENKLQKIYVKWRIKKMKCPLIDRWFWH